MRKAFPCHNEALQRYWLFQTENENLYGHSWTHRTYPDDDEKCEVDCGQPPGGPCAESAMEDAAKICQSLQDPQGSFAVSVTSGPFQYEAVFPGIAISRIKS